MIYLTSKLFDKEINLETSKFYTIVIENRKLNYDVSKYLYNEFSAKEDYFTIFKDDKKLDITNEATFVFNLFSLDLNTKRNINALYKILRKSCSDTLQADIKNIKNEIVKVVQQISLDFDIELGVNNDIREDDLFKIVDLRFSEGDDSYLLRFKKYVETVYELLGVRVFFIYHLHDYFNKNELDTIFHELSYKNMSLINLEISQNYEKSENEEFIVIDQDLCSIE
ncbi:MAG: type II-A CRISPR-associated protein Csn2 [Erysipelotrichaceae bacterium]|jgi:CRISPR type II-A-associated protein Csn2|nr:type II-A CRISPR-associated protein Csn2 [Erysipelotrichaceae bacterium]